MGFLLSLGMIGDFSGEMRSALEMVLWKKHCARTHDMPEGLLESIAHSGRFLKRGMEFYQVIFRECRKRRKQDMKNKWIAAAAAGLFLMAQAAMTAFGADGTWIAADGGWQYQRPDGGMAKGTWEDIDGAWYHFGSDSYMQTGWQKIGNLRYYFHEDGSLAEGWQLYTGDGSEKWYYYDKNGNAAIQWLEADGKTYWLNSSGVLNTESPKTIKGVRYFFNEDGSLKANEYMGFKYMDSDGQPAEEHNVTAENRNGKEITVDEGVRDEIAEKINALPKGWLKKFIDDGWRFIYCPEKEYYSYVKDEDTNERYYFRYKLTQSEHSLRFTDPEAIQAGFGEYMYANAKEELRDYQFSTELKLESYEIHERFEIPEDVCITDPQSSFGLLLSEYLNEGNREWMEEELDDLTWILDRVIELRDINGREVKKE